MKNKCKCKGKTRIDKPYIEIPDHITYKVFNASSILGAVAFFALILAPGAAEGGNYILSLVLIAVFGICAHLSIKEDGRRYK